MPPPPPAPKLGAVAEALVLLVVFPPALLWLACFASTLLVVRRLGRLSDVRVSRTTWPKLSVITPACDEEAEIEPALRSLLGQAYSALEVVAVDDRSTDDTGAIIDRLAIADPRLIPVHVTALPPGWLGKLNALAEGVKRAQGEWLLFTDADVQFDPHALERAIELAEDQQLDLLTAVPELTSTGFLLDVCFNAAGAFACAAGRLWQVPDPKSSAVAGIGAFILVRRSAYDRSPGIEWLKLEVADDVGMGLLIKSHGGRCAVVNGVGQLRLAWYASVRDMNAKMQKNWFAIIGRFSVARLLGIALLFGWLACYPALLLLLGPELGGAGWAAVLVCCLGVLAAIGSSMLYARWTRRPYLPSLFVGGGMLLLAAMMLSAARRGQRAGGISWRGVLYPSALLRDAQRVRF